MSKKVLIVTDGFGLPNYHKPFARFGDVTYDSEMLWENPEKINLVVFTGGADVTPSLYGQEADRSTSCVPRRDIFEQITFTKARQLGLPMAGICRGAQFLNVMAGGKLVQHIDGHAMSGYHDMTTIDNQTFQVSSTHHQMILPPDDAILVGWSTERRSRYYYGEDGKALKDIPEKETEVVFWPKLRAVGMQYHPEVMWKENKGFRYAAELCIRFLNVRD